LGKSLLFQGGRASYNRPDMIHQIQIKYDPLADRLRMQVRTRTGEVFAIWLTRRLVQRLWPAFQQVATQLALGRVPTDALVHPEAQAMIAESVRSRALPNADFSQPFSSEPAQRPLGEEPLLAAEVELQARPQSPGGLRLTVSDGKRRITLQLNDELHSAMLRLLEQAVAAADWGLAPPSSAATAPQAPPSLLN
jgi:hypothetical protein